MRVGHVRLVQLRVRDSIPHPLANRLRADGGQFSVVSEVGNTTFTVRSPLIFESLQMPEAYGAMAGRQRRCDSVSTSVANLAIVE